MKLVFNTTQEALEFAKVVARKLQATLVVNKKQVIIPDNKVNEFNEWSERITLFNRKYKTIERESTTGKVAASTGEMPPDFCDHEVKSRTRENIIREVAKNIKTSNSSDPSSEVYAKPVSVPKPPIKEAPIKRGPTTLDEILGNTLLSRIDVERVRIDEPWGSRKDWKKMRQGSKYPRKS